MYILLYIARYCPADLRALALVAVAVALLIFEPSPLVVPAVVALLVFEPSPSSCLLLSLLLPCWSSSPRPRRACCCCPADLRALAPRRACCCCPADLRALAPRCPCCHVYNTRHRPDTTPGTPGAYYQPARQRGEGGRASVRRALSREGGEG